MIRPAILTDRAEMLALGRELAKDYPLRFESERAYEALTQAIGNRKHFAWVVEENGGVHGMLVALTGDNLWAQRMNSNIVAWVSQVPGEGLALLREYRNWVRSRRGIKVAGMCVDSRNPDPVRTILRRVGFEDRGGANYLFN